VCDDESKTRLARPIEGSRGVIISGRPDQLGWVRDQTSNRQKVSRMGKGRRNSTRRVFAGLHLDRFPSTFFFFYLHRSARPGEAKSNQGKLST
jgi:hypothetical protein